MHGGGDRVAPADAVEGFDHLIFASTRDAPVKDQVTMHNVVTDEAIGTPKVEVASGITVPDGDPAWSMSTNVPSVPATRTPGGYQFTHSVRVTGG